jgi:hypothetical protein
MAARTQLNVGSESWINAEKENVLQLVEQEKEELVYPAQHEMEWLNEHMAEIFSKSQLYLATSFVRNLLTELAMLLMCSRHLVN